VGTTQIPSLGCFLIQLKLIQCFKVTFQLLFIKKPLFYAHFVYTYLLYVPISFTWFRHCHVLLSTYATPEQPLTSFVNIWVESLVMFWGTGNMHCTCTYFVWVTWLHFILLSYILKLSAVPTYPALPCLCKFRSCFTLSSGVLRSGLMWYSFCVEAPYSADNFQNLYSSRGKSKKYQSCWWSNRSWHIHPQIQVE